MDLGTPEHSSEGMGNEVGEISGSGLGGGSGDHNIIMADQWVGRGEISGSWSIQGTGTEVGVAKQFIT